MSDIETIQDFLADDGISPDRYRVLSVVEGSRSQRSVVTLMCLRCGSTVTVTGRVPTDSVDLHDDWHNGIQSLAASLSR